MAIGYDKLSLNAQLLLGLPFEEGTRILTYDRAKAHHELTLNGVPTWNSLANGLPYLDFNSANPDWLDCGAAATADLDFTAGDFSGAIWVRPDSVATAQWLIIRGLAANDGWEFYMDPADLVFRTHQAATTQTNRSAAAIIAATTWNLAGFARDGTSVRLYLNGLDVTATAVPLVNPLTSARELHIGIQNDEATNPYDGRIAGGPPGPRIWGRALSAYEHLQIFNMEKHWFGV